MRRGGRRREPRNTPAHNRRLEHLRDAEHIYEALEEERLLKEAQADEDFAIDHMCRRAERRYKIRKWTDPG